MYKRPYFTLLFLVLGWSTLFAQPIRPQSEVLEEKNTAHFCRTDEWHQQQLRKSAEYRFQKILQSREVYHHMQQKASKGSKRGGPYLLPIVIHIVHDNGPENISDALVLEGIRHINESFANTGYYDPSTGLDTEIQFCLAKRTPDNRATSGITRTRSSLTEFDMTVSDGELKDLSRWDTECYINIWLVREISSSSSTGVAGYATFPFSHGEANDGIVMEARWFGSSEANSAIATHELGHYLGLYHTFQGGCSNNDCLAEGDEVCDTPPDQTTANVPCDQAPNSCQTDTQSGLTTDLPDMINNYMDYSRLECFNAFTPGQTDRMHFFIDDIRKSLSECSSCLDPCPAPISAMFSAPTTQIDIGDQLVFTNQTAGADRFEWYINDSLVATTTDLTYTFLETGTFEIRLFASNSEGSCISDFTLTVEVVCPIRATFTTQGESCLDIGDQLLFVNGSALGVQNQWYVNGSLVSTDRNLNYTFLAAGTYEIQLLTSNNLCQAISTVYTVRVLCVEICNNGRDDDGDGLVDCFDDDCCEECSNYYFSPCADSCTAVVPQPTIQARFEKALYPNSFDPINAVIAGDIYGDGLVEFVGPEASPTSFVISENLIIWEPATSSIQQTIPGYFFYQAQAPVLADIDRDGFAEIFITYQKEDQGYLGTWYPICFKWDGQQYREHWRSEDAVNYEDPIRLFDSGVMSLAIADFHSDGKPELYTLNKIWDASTGELLASGGDTNSMGVSNKTFTSSFTHAIDLLPDDYCTSCNGLELICGNQVYAVSNFPNFDMEVVAESPDIGDGYASVADFDLDGDLDALVLSNNVFMGFEWIIWDVQTPRSITPKIAMDRPIDGNNPYITQPAIGDLDGDGFPDVVLLGHGRTSSNSGSSAQMRMFAWSIKGNNPDLLFIKNTVDESSVSGCSLFDFNYDGKEEILYRDETTFFIFNGEDGQTIYSNPGGCESFTGYEHPIVVDVDNDQEAEVICSCLDGMQIYESNGIPWPNTRQVWNQLNYFKVNINDDMTVPIQQQEHHLPRDPRINSFLQQIPIPTPLELDIELDILLVDSCRQDQQLGVELRVCNSGNRPLDSIYITVYDRNPTEEDASILETIFQVFPLLPDQCTSISFEIDPVGFDQLWFMVNDDGTAVRPFTLDGTFPSPLDECNLINNLTSLQPLPQVLTSQLLDLGPDRIICDNGIFTFEAQAGFLSYLWQDGSRFRTFTADNAGTYWVTVIDNCGNIQTDTVRISIDDATVIELGDDIVLCDPQTLEFQVDGFDRYQWSPSTFLDCDTCNRVQLTPTTSITYTLVASNDNGCISSDTIAIILNDSIYVTESFTICSFDSIWVFDRFESTSGIYERDFITSLGCDSTHRIELTVIDEIETEENLSICPGEGIEIFGTYTEEAGTYTQSYQLSSGCDSTHTIQLIQQAEYLDEEFITLCAGDTIEIWGQAVAENNILERSFQSIYNCDSIERVFVQITDLIEILDSIWLCPGESYLFNGDTIRQAGLYEQVIIPLGDECDTVRQLQVNYYESLQPPFTVETTCPGTSNGSIGLSGPTPGFSYSLDGLSFQDTLLLEGLAAGSYTIYVLDSEGCLSENIVEVLAENTLNVQLPADTIVHPGQFVTLEVNSGGLSRLSYEWEPSTGLSCTDCDGPFVRMTEPTLYVLKATDDEGCTSIDSIFIDIWEPVDIFIPNVFSPNGDNINDQLTVFSGDGVVAIERFRVFNRWGALLFERNNFQPNDPSLGWNGRFKGQWMNSGVYVYTAEIRLEDGSLKVLSGDVTLLR
ncbi:MAG: M43 family zinc metalloprotease [Bacteroidota bacterium]